MYTCGRLHVCIHMCVHVCNYVCMYACMYVCMYVCIHIRASVCIHGYVVKCMYVCMYVCMYTAVYGPHVHTHAHISLLCMVGYCCSLFCCANPVWIFLFDYPQQLGVSHAIILATLMVPDAPHASFFVVHGGVSSGMLDMTSGFNSAGGAQSTSLQRANHGFAFSVGCSGGSYASSMVSGRSGHLFIYLFIYLCVLGREEGGNGVGIGLFVTQPTAIHMLHNVGQHLIRRHQPGAKCLNPAIPSGGREGFGQIEIAFV